MKNIFFILILSLFFLSFEVKAFNIDLRLKVDNSSVFVDEKIYKTSSPISADETWYNRGKCSGIPDKIIYFTSSPVFADKKIFFSSNSIFADMIVCHVD